MIKLLFKNVFAEYTHHLIFLFFLFLLLMRLSPKELMVEFYQLVFFLLLHHEDDHKHSLLNHELLDVCLTNEFFQLYHFVLKMHHYY